MEQLKVDITLVVFYFFAFSYYVLGIHTVQNASRDYTCIHSNQLQLYMLCVVSRKVNI